MIVFIRSSLINRDVRGLKYVHFLDKKSVKFIQWDRSNETYNSDLNDNYITFKLAAGYGLKLKSLGKFFLWNVFIFKTLFQLRNEIKVIQICDLDSFFPSVFFRLLGKKIIFDVYDFFADSKISNRTTITYSILYHLEMFCMRYVDLLILPLELRKKHLNFKPKNLLICENVPHIRSEEEHEFNLDASKLNIIYAGTLENNNRGLEWIPNIAKKLKDQVHFYIAGNGNLNDFFKNAAKENSNITFLGPISHSKAISFQKKADLIFGVYRSNLMNNVMAAPNKFYESTFTGTPLLVNKGLFISDIITKNEIGFVIEENEEAISYFLSKLTKDMIKEVSLKSKKYWQNNYLNYLNRKYEVDYKNHLDFLTNQ